jgi:hypothetical protein
MRRIRFSLRALLVVTALFSVYLAWRVRDTEARASAAIHEAGGKTYYGHQQPWMGSTKFISFAMLPDYEYYSQHDVICTGTPTPPRLTLTEVLFGDTKERRISAVSLPLDSITPQLENFLLTLPELRILMIEMPAMMAHRDSPEAKRLEELQVRFGAKVWPTVNLGM